MQIEKNIPYSKKKVKKETHFPFSEMEIGDSFLMEFNRVNFNINFDRMAVANAACQWGKKTGTKFSIRREENGFRCWRIA